MSTTESPQTEEQPSGPILTGIWKNPALRPFWSLRHRNYAIFWAALSFELWVMNMLMFVRSWYAFELEGRASLIGAVAVAQGIPVLLFSLFGGALADRLNNRNVLIAGFAVNTVSTLGIAVAITIGAIEWWHLLISAMGAGIGQALAMGARFSMIAELVEREAILNANSLANLANNSSRIAAPAVAGFLLAWGFEIEGVFYLMSVLSGVSVLILFMLPSREYRQPAQRQTVLKDMVEGLRYVKEHEIILWLILVYTVTATFGMPYLFLLPVLAKNSWSAEPSQIGLLFSMVGVGALIGSLGTASLGGFNRKGLLLLIVSFGFGAGIIGLALSPIYLIALFVAVPVGVCQSARLSLNPTLVQLQTPAEIRGRVMGVYEIGSGVFSIGVLGVSALADEIPSDYALALSGGAVMAFCIYVFLTRPSIRRLP